MCSVAIFFGYSTTSSLRNPTSRIQLRAAPRRARKPAGQSDPDVANHSSAFGWPMSSGCGEAELHSSALAGLCRVCGDLLSAQRATYACKELGSCLEHTYGINTHSDNPQIHPPKVCYNCYRTTTRHLEYEKGEREYNHAIQVVEWTMHGHDCQTCAMFTKSRQGGRPRKSRKNRGRPTRDETLKKHVSSVAAPKHKDALPLSPSRFVSVRPSVDKLEVGFEKGKGCYCPWYLCCVV